LREPSNTMNVCACGRRTNSDQSICDRCTALLLFGLARDATQAEIKDAYRVLAKVWHPDRFQGDERLRQQAEEKLKEINAAHQLLITIPAEGPHRPTPESGPQPQQPAEPTAADSDARPYSRPQTTSPWTTLHIRRQADRRKRLSLIVAIAVIGAAWTFQRYGRTLAAEFSTTPVTNDASRAVASDNSRQRTKDNATSGASTGADVAARSGVKPTARTRTSASPSLLVYPADDPSVAYFTVGSTRSDVVKVQGTPTKIAGNIFEYGSSEVYFQDGRVQSWHVDPGAPLKARMPE